MLPFSLSTKCRSGRLVKKELSREIKRKKRRQPKRKEGKMFGVNIMLHLFLKSSKVPTSLALSALCVNDSV